MVLKKSNHILDMSNALEANSSLNISKFIKKNEVFDIRNLQIKEYLSMFFSKDKYVKPEITEFVYPSSLDYTVPDMDFNNRYISAFTLGITSIFIPSYSNGKIVTFNNEARTATAVTVYSQWRSYWTSEQRRFRHMCLDTKRAANIIWWNFFQANINNRVLWTNSSTTTGNLSTPGASAPSPSADLPILGVHLPEPGIDKVYVVTRDKILYFPTIYSIYNYSTYMTFDGFTLDEPAISYIYDNIYVFSNKYNSIIKINISNKTVKFIPVSFSRRYIPRYGALQDTFDMIDPTHSCILNNFDICVGTDGGVYLFNTLTEELEYIELINNENFNISIYEYFSDNKISSMVSAANGRAYILYEKHGIILEFDPEIKSFSLIHMTTLNNHYDYGCLFYCPPGYVYATPGNSLNGVKIDTKITSPNLNTNLHAYFNKN